MLRFLPVILLLLFLSCAPNPIHVIETFTTAHNGDDVAGQMDLLAENILFSCEGQWEKHGIGEVKGMLEWDAAIHSRYSFRDLNGEGETIRCLLVETNDWLALMEVDSLSYVGCFTVREGKIFGLHTILTGPSYQRLMEKMDHFRPWSEENFASEFEDVYRDGAWSFSAHNARKWMSLITAWKNAQE